MNIDNLIKYTYKTPKIWYASGVIIFNHDFTKTIIVKGFDGNIGFPKGGREPNERVHQTAHREVKEETGLKTYQYRHDNMLIGEKKGKPENPNLKYTIYYFIASIPKNVENIKLKCFNPKELCFVDWVLVEDACKILNSQRRDILLKAQTYIINKNQEQKQNQDQNDKNMIVDENITVQ
jgi:8-oxo-dGTP pyrophosphatase MutT (NUDIX family)